MLGLGWTYTRGEGALIHGERFVLGLGWTYTEGGTYSWREVCVRFRMDIHTGVALIHSGKLVLGLGWTYTLRGVLIHVGEFVLGLGWTLTHTEGVHLFMMGSLF